MELRRGRWVGGGILISDARSRLRGAPIGAPRRLLTMKPTFDART